MGTSPVAIHERPLVSRPLHGLVHLVTFPSSKLLGYYQSSAIRGLGQRLWGKA